jgi:HEAT repeat protein
LLKEGLPMSEMSERLRRALESDDAMEIGRVIQAQREEDFEALSALLSPDPLVNPRHRTRAIYALGRWGDPASVGRIRDLLPNLDEPGRITAVGALGRLGTAEALDGVLDYATDPSPHVRKSVVSALGSINTPRAQAKLKEIAESQELEPIRSAASRLLEDQ